MKKLKNLFSIKYLTAWVFLLILMFFFAKSIRGFSVSAANELISDFADGHSFRASVVEKEYDDKLPSRTRFITLNGGIQRLSGRRAVNERYLMNNGHLTYIIPETDMSGIAENTVEFKNALDELEIPMAYISAPFKIDRNDKQLPVGVEDYSNENADEFISILNDNSVPVLDLRDRIDEEGLDHYSLFFRTDHHWTAEAGFWAFNEIVDYLTAMDDSFAVDPVIRNIDSYNCVVYDDVSFLGSHGRRIGPLYDGFDDISIITPKFETSLTLNEPYDCITRSGSYDDVILCPEHLYGNYYFTSAYSVYCGDEAVMTELDNHSSDEGLTVCSTDKRILIVNDSFSHVIAPFMALAYNDVQFVDLRLFPSDLLEYIKELDPDIVLVLYNPGALEDNNLCMFDFINKQ